MADILSFRAKAQAATDASSKQDFLHRDDHTLSFEVTESGDLGITNILERRSETSDAPALNDWSNQELADLYRVKRLLDAAGVPNELDRGLTDEGDPWLVFVGPDGEVFIHLCRLDALYVLDSPNLQAPLRGADFNALIEAFTNRALPRTGAAAEDGGARVIRLERGGKVYLHPSALMAALIWTLFLAAEEIVLMTPDADQMADGLDDISALTFGDVSVAVAETPFIVAQSETLIDGMDPATLGEPRQVTAQEAFMRDTALGGTGGISPMQTSYGLGLSTIAIAFGFMADQTLSEERVLVAEDTMAVDADDTLEDDGDARQIIQTEAVTPAEIIAPEVAELALQNLSDPLLGGEDVLAEAETIMTATDAVATDQVLTHALEVIQTKIAQATLWVDTTFKAAAPKEIVTAEAPVENTVEKPAPPVMKAETSDAKPLPVLLTLSTLKTVLTPLELETYTLGDTQITATFSLDTDTIDSLAFLDEDPVFETPMLANADLTPLPQNTHPIFDDDARAFMNFIIAKLDAIEMISLENQMILIDSAVFNSTESYSLSWALDGGGTVSVIGQRSEFAEFDLIA